MTSRTTKRFRKLLAALSPHVQRQAREAYLTWMRDPWHASLQFKQIHSTKPIFSARIGLDWRAVCIRSGDTVLWYFIGSHGDYDRLIATLQKVRSKGAIDGTVKLWNVGANANQFCDIDSIPVGLHFSRDGRFNGRFENNRFTIGNLATGELVTTLGEREASFSPDGRFLVSESGDCTTRLWGGVVADQRAA